jgi:hypothetical protein
MRYVKSCTTSTLLTKNTRNYVDNFGNCVGKSFLFDFYVFDTFMHPNKKN